MIIINYNSLNIWYREIEPIRLVDTFKSKDIMCVTHSMNDVFKNGARFIETGAGRVKPNYNREQVFLVADVRTVRSLTKSAGALRCTPQSRCWSKEFGEKNGASTWRRLNIENIIYRST